MRPLFFRSSGLLLGLLLAGFGGAPGRAQEAMSAVSTPRDEIVHVLNRITFGPRPGDVEKVEQMGLQNYIRQQLHPESIDDSAVDAKVAGLETLNMTNQELLTFYSEEKKKAIQRQKEIGQTPEQIQADNAAMASLKPAIASGEMDMETVMERLRKIKSSPMGELSEAKLIRAVDSNRQLQEVLVDFWTNHFNIDMHKGLDKVLKVSDDRDVIRPNIFGKFRDLLEASAKSPAMLFYLDNALNSAPRMMTPFEQNMRADYMEKNLGVPAGPPAKKGKKDGGINENYAREIMELHTLGVDGGYTQKDVQEVARCFTGWTIDRRAGGFKFDSRRHDDGVKTVLGHVIPAHGGINDGEMVLDILCSSPATAHHISYELCQRFISDTPPDSVVDRTAAVFQSTGGDLRQVVGAILSSPEFLSPSSFGVKIKSPLEYTVSAVRATESIILPPDNSPLGRLRPILEAGLMSGREGKGRGQRLLKGGESLNYHIYALGEPLFNCIPPTGYKETSTQWVSPGALIERLNFALALTEQKVSDVQFDARRLLGNADLDQPEEVLERCVSTLLPGGISNSTRNVLMSAAVPTSGDSKTIDPSKLIALILGSPEFQRK